MKWYNENAVPETMINDIIRVGILPRVLEQPVGEKFRLGSREFEITGYATRVVFLVRILEELGLKRFEDCRRSLPTEGVYYAELKLVESRVPRRSSVCGVCEHSRLDHRCPDPGRCCTRGPQDARRPGENGVCHVDGCSCKGFQGETNATSNDKIASTD